ncbi:MAG: YetF domain-containing protein [Bacillota bacterium]
MVQEIAQSGIKTLIAYILLLILTRMMGRKMVAQVTFFDFVVAIIVGSVVANIAVNQDMPLVSGFTVLVVLSAMTILVQVLLLKSFLLRKLIDFGSIVVIENGKIISENLKTTRLRLDNLLMLLREKDAFSIADVEYAVLETDGKLSVLKKSQKLPVTPADLNIPTAYIGLTKDIIMDGEVMEKNLRGANLDKDWLMRMLKAQNYNRVEDVFYAGLDATGNLYISSRNRNQVKKEQSGIE